MRASLQFRISAALIAGLLLATLVNFAIIFYSLRTLSNDSIVRTEKNYISQVNNNLRDLVSVAHSTVQQFYNQSKDVEKLQEIKLAELKKVLEVRKLAEKTMGATREVGDNIRAIQDAASRNVENVDRAAAAVEQATEKANLSGETLAEIVQLASRSATQVDSIASAAEEQSAATEQISRPVESVHDIAMQTVADMSRSTENTRRMAELAEDIRVVIDKLKEG